MRAVALDTVGQHKLIASCNELFPTCLCGKGDWDLGLAYVGLGL